MDENSGTDFRQHTELPMYIPRSMPAYDQTEVCFLFGTDTPIGFIYNLS